MEDCEMCSYLEFVSKKIFCFFVESNDRVNHLLLHDHAISVGAAK